MIGIYRITNKLNGKFYIGQSRDVSYRIKQHLMEANDPKSLAYNTPLHKDIREFGWENFNSEVLLTCKVEELSRKEQDLINAAEIMSKNLLYNLRNDYIDSKIAQYDLKGNLIKVWDSTKEIRSAGFEISNILKACRGTISSSKGSLWRFVKSEAEARGLQEELNYDITRGGQRREIVQYDLQTRAVISRFPSGRAAAIALGKTSGTSPILNTCKGKQRQAYGYGWAYADEFENWE